jgi:hypothetical protein
MVPQPFLFFPRGQSSDEEVSFVAIAEHATVMLSHRIPLGRNKTLFLMSKGLIWLMFHALQVRQGPMEN